MKKAFKILMASAGVLSVMTACTPQPSPTEKGIQVSELADYTIVYPSEYTELRMDIVSELQDVIEHLTNVRIKAIPDTEPEAEKEIILASSKRTTSFDAEIDDFASRMDYIVAKDNDNIVLGGQNYYSDMRAVYDFMSNYLGYDSLEGTYSEPTKNIAGTYVNIYKEPEFIIQAACWATLFDKESYIKDIRDASFNMLMIDFSMSPENTHNLTKWCAKYDVSIMVNTCGSAVMPNVEIYSDCPIVWGGYVYDEPSEDQFQMVHDLCDKFNADYAQYGFKPFVNFAGERADFVKETDLFGNIDVMSYDWYIFVNNNPEGWCGTQGEGSYYLKRMQTYMQVSKERGMEFWTYIQAYRRSGGIFVAEKAYKWQMYMNLCFGSKAMLYFIYANQSENEPNWGDFSTLVVNRDMSKGDNYYYAKEANEEILKVYDILKDYDNVGAYTYFTRESQLYAEFDEYKDFGVIEDIVDMNSTLFSNSSYLVGCFEKKEGNGKAFIFMNLEIINDADLFSFPVKLKINGENIKCYIDGEVADIEPDEDGYYTVKAGNGQCMLFTVE